MSVEITEDPARLLEIKTNLDELTANASEPNIFLEPWMVLPALELPEAQGALHVLVWQDGNAGSKSLLGYMPLQRRKGRAGIFLNALQSWHHRFRFLGEPLIQLGHEEEFWRSVLAFFDGKTCFGASLRLTRVMLASRSTEVLFNLAHTSNRPIYTTRSYERAILEGGMGYDEYLLAHIRRKARKEYKRQYNRLSELGKISVEIAQNHDNVSSWTEDFLQLEKNGWKGAAGTAIACDPDEIRYFKEIIQEAHAQDRLTIIRITLNDQILSMLINIDAPLGGSFSLKTTFNESYAQYSPGVMMQLKYLKHALDVAQLNWVDSCALPDHPMIDSIWRGRRTIVSLCVPFDRKLARWSNALEISSVAFVKPIVSCMIASRAVKTRA